MSLFVFLKFVEQLVTPPGSMGLALVIALVLAPFGLRRLARLALGLAFAETLVLSFPPVGDALVMHLEDQATAAAQAAPKCCYDAIVVLGGGIAPAMPPLRDFPDLSDASDRVWHAARLYHRHVAPRIIASGGGYMAKPGDPSTTEAEAMRTFLIDLGVPSEAIVAEGTSLNTLENLQHVRALVGDKKVALVTSAMHMPRALQSAARARLDVGAFPTDYRALPGPKAPWDDWIPSQEALGMSCAALHELAGLWLDFRRGRTP